MRLLLDTHAFLWWLAGDARLPPRAREAIADAANEVYVSAASAWEVATKARLGKLPEAARIAHDFESYIQSQQFLSLSISVEHGQRAGLLAGEHRDPFDRMLVAQSQAENMVLVSNEEIFDSMGATRLWK
ncbi:MAG TPA: type II toxin-antitoxin system VapC family toxin [Longimicrobium sp.]|nr:type II toxin-antitoxin system VapC family toxin [Longimicrobium sp.]